MNRLTNLISAVILLAALSSCGSDEAGPADAAASPAAGDACSQLRGPDGLVQQALDLADQGPQDGTGVQGRLFALVTTAPADLADPVGQLVDFLDDPDAYLTDGKPNATITTAVDAIDWACS